MSGHRGPVDVLADELLAAIRDHQELHDLGLLDPSKGEAHRRLCAAYNRLYCELHDKATVCPPTALA